MLLQPGPAPRRRRVPRLAAAGLSAAALTLVAACASSSSGGSSSTALTPRQALLAAASQSRNVTSATEILAVQVGGAQSATTTGTVQLRLKPSLEASENLSANVAGQSTKVKAVVTRKAIYLSEPALAQQLGKPWVKIDLSALNGTAVAGIGQLLHSLQNNDFANQTALLTAAKNAHVVRTQTVGGVSTTEYAGSFKAAQGLKALNPSLRQALASELQALGNTTITFHEWIDAQHHLRKFTEAETVNGQPVTTTVTITSINQPVTITPPPASQTATTPGL